MIPLSPVSENKLVNSSAFVPFWIGSDSISFFILRESHGKDIERRRVLSSDTRGQPVVDIFFFIEFARTFEFAVSVVVAGMS